MKLFNVIRLVNFLTILILKGVAWLGGGEMLKTIIIFYPIKQRQFSKGGKKINKGLFYPVKEMDGRSEAV